MTVFLRVFPNIGKFFSDVHDVYLYLVPDPYG